MVRPEQLGAHQPSDDDGDADDEDEDADAADGVGDGGRESDSQAAGDSSDGEGLDDIVLLSVEHDRPPSGGASGGEAELRHRRPPASP